MSFSDVTLYLLDGFGLTCLLFVLTLLLSLPLGLLICFGSMSKFKPLKIFVDVFVWIIRGVPLMLQIFVIYYVPGFMGFQIFSQVDLYFTLNFGVNDIGRFLAVLIAFAINYACYFSVIYRGGIQSISQGQYEAGQVLGMSKSTIFRKIVLLQVIKRIVPPMSSEIITLVKDTSLARVVMVVELICAAEKLMAKAIIWPLFYAGAFYLIFVGVLTIAFNFLEKKLSYFKV